MHLIDIERLTTKQRNAFARYMMQRMCFYKEQLAPMIGMNAGSLQLVIDGKGNIDALSLYLLQTYYKGCYSARNRD